MEVKGSLSWAPLHHWGPPALQALWACGSKPFWVGRSNRVGYKRFGAHYKFCPGGTGALSLLTLAALLVLSPSLSSRSGGFQTLSWHHPYIYSSPMTSLVLTDSSQLRADVFEKLPDQIMYPYAEPHDLQKHHQRSHRATVYTLSDSQVCSVLGSQPVKPGVDQRVQCSRASVVCMALGPVVGYRESKVEAMRELSEKPHTVEALSYHVTANSPVREWAPHADQSVISNGGLSYPVNQDATKVTELEADLNQQSIRIKMNGIQKQTINFDSRAKNLNGPNQVLPADKLHTVLPHGRVKLRTEEEGLAALRPISVPGVLDRTAEQYPEAVALAHKGMGGTWQQITFRDYRTAVRTCSKAFLKLGLKRHHSVCILGFNSPEWLISDLAAIHAGGFAAGIYTTNSPEACHYCAENSKANIIVVEDQTQLDKILQIRERLPELKAIIQYRGTPPDTPGIYSWDDVMKMGQEESDEELEQVLKTIAINECCTLVYTSGTVGNPKAVMLSHDNLTWSAQVLGEYLHVVPGSGEKLVSFLPLSHVAAQLCTWGTKQPLCILGRCNVEATYNGRSATLPITLVEGNGPSLLQRNWFIEFGIKVQGIHHINDKGAAVWARQYGVKRLKWMPTVVIDVLRRNIPRVSFKEGLGQTKHIDQLQKRYKRTPQPEDASERPSSQVKLVIYPVKDLVTHQRARPLQQPLLPPLARGDTNSTDRQHRSTTSNTRIMASSEATETVAYSSGTLVNTLQEVRPTRFIGVPRVWEKIYEKMTRIGSQNGYIKRSIATWAKGHGLQHNLDKMNGAMEKLSSSEPEEEVQDVGTEEKKDASQRMIAMNGFIDELFQDRKVSAGVTNRLKSEVNNLLVIANPEGQVQQLTLENTRLREEESSPLGQQDGRQDGSDTVDQQRDGKQNSQSFHFIQKRGRYKEYTSKVGKMVVIETEDSEDTENIKNGIQALEGLKCEDPRKRKPLVTIFDVPSDMTVEELADTGRITQKEFLEGFEPRFKTGVKKRRVTNHVVDVSARVRNLLFGGRVYLHFNGVSVMDYLVITRCNQCRDLGHRVKFCPKKESTMMSKDIMALMTVLQKILDTLNEMDVGRHNRGSKGESDDKKNNSPSSWGRNMRRTERYREGKSETKISTQLEQQVREGRGRDRGAMKEQKEETGKEKHPSKPLEVSTESEKAADGDEGKAVEEEEENKLEDMVDLGQIYNNFEETLQLSRLEEQQTLRLAMKHSEISCRAPFQMVKREMPALADMGTIRSRMRIDSNSLGYSMASLLVFSKIKKALGLDRCKTFLNGAAPLSIEIKKYFLSLDILLCDDNSSNIIGKNDSTAHKLARSSLQSFLFIRFKNLSHSVYANLKFEIGGWRCHVTRIDSNSLGYSMASLLVFSKIKKALGLDRCKTFLNGAAPLSIEIKKYFLSLDILLCDAYGMSETTAGHRVSRDDTFRLTSAGKSLPGTKTKIYNPGQDQQGEVCMWGRHIFMGYLNNELNTSESLDEEGWLHSGDIGQLDEEGFLYITGRIKELLITAGGENIPPVIIEDSIKTELPFLSNATLIGDQRKFLSVLLTFKTNINMETGEALDEVTSEVKDWLTSLGSKASTVSQILEENSEKVMAAIQQGIDRANTKAISNAQKVQKYAILPKDFSIPSGELGPTLKLKRNFIAAKYSDIIESFYPST
uniref:long-chain-fatty-acid--CoA ligase n=1 Tax=Timema californicum TaxID=61474 RepID=A0A7R9J639_TIMCA|nr:unnamed protein product [Timema californicum]